MAKKDPAGDTLVFETETKHGTHRFPADTPICFKSDEAAAYFKKAFGAKPTSDEPKMIIEEDEIVIDPDTIHNETGLKVADLEAPGV